MLIGPRTEAQLDDLLGAADVALDADMLDAVDDDRRPRRRPQPGRRRMGPARALTRGAPSSRDPAKPRRNTAPVASRPMSDVSSLEHLAATPETCYWGYLDADQPPVLTRRAPGPSSSIEAVTHHAGDAPDLLMDDGIAAIWAAIPEADAGARACTS